MTVKDSPQLISFNLLDVLCSFMSATLPDHRAFAQAIPILHSTSPSFAIKVYGSSYEFLRPPLSLRHKAPKAGLCTLFPTRHPLLAYSWLKFHRNTLTGYMDDRRRFPCPCPRDSVTVPDGATQRDRPTVMLLREPSLLTEAIPWKTSHPASQT